jgi:hypothetical protein
VPTGNLDDVDQAVQRDPISVDLILAYEAELTGVDE